METGDIAGGVEAGDIAVGVEAGEIDCMDRDGDGGAGEVGGGLPGTFGFLYYRQLKALTRLNSMISYLICIGAKVRPR